MSSLRHSFRSALWRVSLVLLGTVFLIDLTKLSWTGSHDRHNAYTSTPPVPTPSIYVASIFWNSAHILHASWNSAILDLAEKLGPDNIFISIYESGSWDETKQLLRQLERTLITRGIRHRIVLDKTTHQDEIDRPSATEGWVETPRGKTELRRIPYLSKLRNKTLEPLAEFSANVTTFDKVLFMNDVVFTIQDIWTLLETNSGDYAAACSLDFSKPPNFYYTFALRDSEGHERLTMNYPYFRSRQSRRAMLSHRLLPVQSCWNRISEPHDPLHTTSRGFYPCITHRPAPDPLPVAFDSFSFYQAIPLRFRGISDSLALNHLEGSECCLIHADNPQSAVKGVWLNPRVRVGYDLNAYNAVHTVEPWPGLYDRLVGLWQNRFRRGFTTVWFKEWVVRKRLRAWANEDVAAPNLECLASLTKCRFLFAMGGPMFEAYTRSSKEANRKSKRQAALECTHAT